MMEVSNSNSLKFGSIRELFFHNLERPIILKMLLKENKEWTCINWNVSDWSKLFGNDSYPFHFGEKLFSCEKLETPQWECKNLKGNMTFDEFLHWKNGKKIYNHPSKHKISVQEYWAYMNYFYMKNLIDKEMIEDMLSWDSLGFPDIKVNDSTLWIGTTGANTPCHLDTYGANIVCQIYGKKRWTLFPRGESPNLYPTRIPYEESSIYSEVNFLQPSTSIFPNILKTSPYVVTLEAGDVLFVPKHWWHFVENLDFSISINAWVPLASDEEERLKETLVMYQVGSLSQSITDAALIQSIFNPNMMDIVSMDSCELFELLKQKVLLYINNNSKNSEEKTTEKEHDMKKIKLEKQADISEDVTMEYVKHYSFKDYCSLVDLKIYNGKDESDTSPPLDLTKLIIKTFTDERVIDTIKMVLEENAEKHNNSSQN